MTETEETENEITLKNTWIEDDIDSIFKFPRSNTIIITFTQTITAKRCTEIGLLAFNLCQHRPNNCPYNTPKQGIRRTTT